MIKAHLPPETASSSTLKSLLQKNADYVSFQNDYHQAGLGRLGSLSPSRSSWTSELPSALSTPRAVDLWCAPSAAASLAERRSSEASSSRRPGKRPRKGFFKREKRSEILLNTSKHPVFLQILDYDTRFPFQIVDYSWPLHFIEEKALFHWRSPVWVKDRSMLCEHKVGSGVFFQLLQSPAVSG